MWDKKSKRVRENSVTEKRINKLNRESDKCVLERERERKKVRVRKWEKNSKPCDLDIFYRGKVCEGAKSVEIFGLRENQL